MIRESRGHDFVHDEQCAQFVGGGVEILEVRFVSGDTAAGALEGLNEYGC